MRNCCYDCTYCSESGNHCDINEHMIDNAFSAVCEKFTEIEVVDFGD